MPHPLSCWYSFIINFMVVIIMIITILRLVIYFFLVFVMIMGRGACLSSFYEMDIFVGLW